MLSTAEISTIDVLRTGREATPDDLVEEIGRSRKHVYRVLDDMIEDGFLTESRGRHNQRRVRVTGNPVVEAYRRLTADLGHVDWPELLSPATLRVCWHLDEPRRVTEIADRLGISRQRVYETLSPLENRAMLAPSGPEYALADDLQPLLRFARAVVTQEHRNRARRVAPSATIEWCDPTRALVRVHEPEDTDALRSNDDWRLTGLAKFREYGLQFLLSGEPAFWYAPEEEEELTPGEVVCHTLALNADSRRVSYAMLLIEAQEVPEATLAETAVEYGVETPVSELYRALDGDFDATENVSLPGEREYSSLKSQYDVE